MQIKTKIVSFHTVNFKPVKQEVNGTVILPPLVFPVCPLDFWPNGHFEPNLGIEVLYSTIFVNYFAFQVGAARHHCPGVDRRHAADQIRNLTNAGST